MGQLKRMGKTVRPRDRRFQANIKGITTGCFADLVLTGPNSSYRKIVRIVITITIGPF